jgi:hypothetical protein
VVAVQGVESAGVIHGLAQVREQIADHHAALAARPGEVALEAGNERVGRGPQADQRDGAEAAGGAAEKLAAGQAGGCHGPFPI